MSRAGRGRALLLLGFALSCQRGERSEIERAEFGVLYGGDIQDRTSVQQELALRVSFREPVRRERLVRWEFERPIGDRKAPDGGALFSAELGEVPVHVGERRADAKLAFRKSDRPGTFRIRVRVDDKVVLERAFEVVPP
jgi:hypothetical protein